MAVFTQAAKFRYFAQLLAKELIWLVERPISGKRSELGCLCKCSLYSLDQLPVVLDSTRVRANEPNKIIITRVEYYMEEPGQLDQGCVQVVSQAGEGEAVSCIRYVIASLEYPL